MLLNIFKPIDTSAFLVVLYWVPWEPNLSIQENSQRVFNKQLKMPIFCFWARQIHRGRRKDAVLGPSQVLQSCSSLVWFVTHSYQCYIMCLHGVLHTHTHTYWNPLVWHSHTQIHKRAMVLLKDLTLSGDTALGMRELCLWALEVTQSLFNYGRLKTLLG